MTIENDPYKGGAIVEVAFIFEFYKHRTHKTTY